MVVVLLTGCSSQASNPPIVDIQLYQQWQLQPGDTIAGRSVTGGLGDISIELDGNAVYAPFDGKVDPTKANCVLFSSPDVPGYLFRFCGLTAPKLGDVLQGDPIGTGNHLEFAALRKQSDGRWAMVEPAKSILERTLRKP
ncbi:MAG: M23 family metallopeptidase [Scytolyngbya sp. HA4215-MV1]|nr:M23 family metallopeptidase [Scytolyngbya sp. HA4215-MV1]